MLKNWFEDDWNKTLLNPEFPCTAYTEIASKLVRDSDGFLTDYTMYRRSDGLYVFVFGDADLYHPEDEYWDYETDSVLVAFEWFEDYGNENEIDWDEE